jgi:hypothetical protein
MIRCDFLLIDDLLAVSNESYLNMSAAFRRGMESSWTEPGHTCFIFLTPDSVWSDGSFRMIETLLDRDYKAAMVIGFRTEMEKMRPFLEERIAANPENPVIANRTLASKTIEALHPMMKIMEWTSPGFTNTWPQHVYWHTGEDSIALHSFMPHPFFILSPKRAVPFTKAMDIDYLSKLGYPKSSIHIATNSDIITVVELTPGNRDWGQPLAPARVKSLLRFGFFQADHFHWHYFGHRFMLYGEKPMHKDGSLTFEMDGILDAVLRFSWAGQVRRFGSRKLAKYLWRLIDRLPRSLLPKTIRSKIDL